MKFSYFKRHSISTPKSWSSIPPRWIPKLRQAQVDELVKIFEDEKKKFAELSKKYTEQLEKLAQKHFEDWMDLENSYKLQKKSVEDDQKAEEIRKKLGLA